MESSSKNKNKNSNDKNNNNNSLEEDVKVIQWEDFEQELARLCSLTSALNEAKQKKQSLQEKLQSHIQVEAESLGRSNELDKMREKLESRKLVMGNMSMHSNILKEKDKKQEEQLSTEIRSLLVAGSALSVAGKHLQDTSRSLAGEKGYGHLKTLQKLIRVRQQQMISQVSLLYPVKVVVGHAHEHELESFTTNFNSVCDKAGKWLPETSLSLPETLTQFGV